MASSNRLSLDDKLNALGTNLLAHIKSAINESEARIIEVAKSPDRWIDKKLVRLSKSQWSHIWVGLIIVGIVVATLWIDSIFEAL